MEDEVADDWKGSGVYILAEKPAAHDRKKGDDR